MEKVVIIGSGCAGLTAALYTARADLKPLVIAGSQPGGLLTTTTTVENFPGFPEGIDGYELAVRMQKQAERFGARIQFGVVEALDLSGQPLVLTIDGDRVETETVIVASGARHRHLGLESESKLEKKGVTYCATCDGALPVFRNQPLVVVGGGDSACEEAMYLTRFGSIVYLAHRRDKLRASKIMADRALSNPKVRPIWDSVVVDVLDATQGKVTGVRLKNVKTGAESVVACAGVFVAIGHLPNTELFRGSLDMDERGYLVPKSGTATKVPGVFVAGDCADRVYRQAITAAGSGCAAAIEAERYLAARQG
ncbi:MAG: thioredoxin-disulfide reductase [Limisphaerales bacterium]